MAGLCFYLFWCGSLVKWQARVGEASWSSCVVWQQRPALYWGGVAEVQCDNVTPQMLTSIYPKVPAILDLRQSAGPCHQTPAIEVGQNKSKTERKRRIFSVLGRWETHSVVKYGQAVPSEGIQDTCMVLTDRASSRKPNTCSISHSSRDLSSGKASKPWEQNKLPKVMQEDRNKLGITCFSWIQICKILVPVFSKVTPWQALTSRHCSLLNIKQKFRVKLVISMVLWRWRWAWRLEAKCCGTAAGERWGVCALG